MQLPLSSLKLTFRRHTLPSWRPSERATGRCLMRVWVAAIRNLGNKEREMDVFTLYAGQGDLAVVRAAGEAIIIDSHMPDCDDVNPTQIEASLDAYLAKTEVRGLILTGLDKDHACPAGVESILSKYSPSWVMYPKYYKDTDAATEVFS